MQYYCEGVFGAANGHCRLAVTTMLFLVPGDGRMTDDGGKLNPATTTRVPEISVCFPECLVMDRQFCLYEYLRLQVGAIPTYSTVPVAMN